MFANGVRLIHHLDLLRAEPFGSLEDEGVEARCHVEVQHMAIGHILEALRLERQAAQDVHDVQGGPDLAQGRDGTRRTAAPSGESEIVEDPRRSYPPR